MWLYTSEGDATETLTCLETGAQVIRSGEGAELWWRKNDAELPLEQDEMKLAGADGQRHFQGIVDALVEKGDLAGYVGPVKYPIPGE